MIVILLNQFFLLKITKTIKNSSLKKKNNNLINFYLNQEQRIFIETYSIIPYHIKS